MFSKTLVSLSGEQTSVLLERLVTSFPMGICLVDSEDRLIYANPRYLELFNLSAESLPGLNCREVEKAHISSIIGNEQVNDEQHDQMRLDDGHIFERTSLQINDDEQGDILLVMWQDISKHEKARTELDHQLGLFRNLANILPDQLFIKDKDRHYTQVNESFLNRRGLSGSEPLEQLSDKDLLAEESFGHVEKEERYLFESGEPIVNQVRQEVWRNGERVWNQYTKMPIFDAFGEVTGLYGYAHDVTDKKRSEQLIWRQANYDHLTQLPNRRLLGDRWHGAWQSHLRDKKSIGLLLLDLDGFKMINDSKGHQAGEGVLISVAERLRRCTRGKDTVARLSGDEFAILATDIKVESDLDVVISKVVRQFSEPFIIDREEVVISASLGVALAPRDGSDLDSMMMYADQALHAAKRVAGTSYRKFSAELHEAVSKQFTLGNDLRYALRNREFTLNFQPIIDLETGKAVKVETLIRWHHSVRGWVSPVDFIPVAEQTGQIVQIGDWVFREAVATVARINQEKGLNIGVSVNVSPRQLQADNFDPDDWLEYMSDQGLNPELMVIEITEGLFLDPDEKVLRALDRFSSQGVRVSLDDFGTGYASISFLENFEIDVLKLDQAFVRDSERSPKRRILSEAIINMAKALEFEIVAEGIETQEQADWIKAAGCEFGQGYYFSKPLTEGRLEEYLEGL